MENKNIIIILVAVVIVLAVIAGAMFMQQSHAKEPTKLKITSDKKQTEGGKLKIQLTDTNKTALSKEIVNITVTDKKGKTVVDDVVKLDLNLKKGKYTVNVTYGGNENHTGNTTVQKLTIKEKAKKTTSKKNSVDTSAYPDYSPKVGNYRLIESQQEIGLIETPDGNNYVITGDGIRTYEGHDSQGHIEFGPTIS